MKKNILSILFFSPVFILAILFTAGAQTTSKNSFYSVSGDPLKARIYKLNNGLSVYLTVYKDAPRIYTYIAVRAGSKNDPSDATGLAHYLEHMLFKGTDRYGVKDVDKEKAELEKIESLYETYRGTADSVRRKFIYHQIDSISGVAAKYAIANEYDKMTAAIGAQGTNAYTSEEQTVYINDIPSNQLEKWLTIEAERFRNPVMRIFHTELEAVYEEKNRSLDSDGSKTWEALFSGLFQKHTYGTQTTIGTIDHLKNPSIKKIREYYDKYYVPGNMAICLSGDFDPEEVMRLIDAKFGSLPAKPVPSFTPPVEDPITKPVIKEVLGPDAESVMMSFRLPGALSPDADKLELVSAILFNGTAGLIDLNLNQSQKVLSAQAFSYVMKDYSALILGGDPREGQKLEEVRDLLLQQIEKIKKGEFPEWLTTAIINDMKLQQIKSFEDNSSRAGAFVEAFVLGMDWAQYATQMERLAKITRQEIIDFANKYFADNYVIAYKRTGEDNNAQRVTKPQITPVEVNREAQSDFLKNLTAMNTPEIQPVFLDYNKDIGKLKMKNGINILYKENTENNLFDLYYVFDMGSGNDRKIGTAVNYLEYLGTSQYSPAALKEEFYKIGCSFTVSSSEDQVYVNLSGLADNFEKGLALFESLLADPKPDKEALANLVDDILKKRSDDKLSKQTILWNALYSYGQYGAKSPFTSRISEHELRVLTPGELTSIIKGITSFEHRVLYYGPLTGDKLIDVLDRLHLVPAKLKPVPPAVKFEEQQTGDNVCIVDYDMKQAEIILLYKGEKYNKTNVPVITLFNEYFGGGMSSVVFQDMRESKALAYSVFASYATPRRPDRAHYILAYVGTQADKLPEAMAGMSALLKAMPESDVTFNAAKASVVQRMQTERITKSAILFNYERAKKMGLDHDIRKDIYDKVPLMTLQHLKDFQKQYFLNARYTVLALGDKSQLDAGVLSKYGKVKFVSLKDIFGY